LKARVRVAASRDETIKGDFREAGKGSGTLLIDTDKSGPHASQVYTIREGIWNVLFHSNKEDDK
jgi:hypothetical protein